MPKSRNKRVKKHRSPSSPSSRKRQKENAWKRKAKEEGVMREKQLQNFINNLM